MTHALWARWNPRRHPPLSVAITQDGLESAGRATKGLMGERRQGKRICTLLDRINRRYGKNALYFSAMRDALSSDTAPMGHRCGFRFKEVQTGFEEDLAPCGQRPAVNESTGELWLQKERQYKVLADATHCVSQQRQCKKAGAGGSTVRRKKRFVGVKS